MKHTPPMSASGKGPSLAFMALLFAVAGGAALAMTVVLLMGRATTESMNFAVPADTSYVHEAAAQTPPALRNDFAACMRQIITQDAKAGDALLRSDVDDCETYAKKAQEKREAIEARGEVRAKYLAALQ